MNIVITGASRGLGLEFLRQWAQEGHAVAALARQPEVSRALQGLIAEFGETVFAVPCDVADDASVAAAQSAVAGRWDRVDLVLNNAGVMGDRSTFAELDLADVQRTFDVNTVGPLRVSRAFLPLLCKGTNPKLVLMTSKMGSISDNASGGAWSYRISKTALNMVGRNLMHELAPAGVCVVMLHPGWVQTDMGGAIAPVTPQESIAGMIAVLDRLAPADSGGFFDYTGAAVPW